MKTLYHHTYHRVVNITADYGAQCFRDIMVVAKTAIKLALVERDMRALDTANTVADVLDVLHNDEDCKDTGLLEEIVNYLPEAARAVAFSLLDQYNSYLKVFEEELPVQELPTSDVAVPEGTRARVEYTSKDCKVMLHMLLHICWQWPHDKDIVNANSGSTIVVFLIDKAFMGKNNSILINSKFTAGLSRVQSYQGTSWCISIECGPTADSAFQGSPLQWTNWEHGFCGCNKGGSYELLILLFASPCNEPLHNT